MDRKVQRGFQRWNCCLSVGAGRAIVKEGTALAHGYGLAAGGGLREKIPTMLRIAQPHTSQWEGPHTGSAPVREEVLSHWFWSLLINQLKFCISDCAGIKGNSPNEDGLDTVGGRWGSLPTRGHTLAADESAWWCWVLPQGNKAWSVLCLFHCCQYHMG